MYATSKVADKLYHIMAYQMHLDGKQWMHTITIQSRQRRWSTIWNLINFPSLVFCVVFYGPLVIFLFLVNVRKWNLQWWTFIVLTNVLLCIYLFIFFYSVNFKLKIIFQITINRLAWKEIQIFCNLKLLILLIFSIKLKMNKYYKSFHFLFVCHSY
jgi:hypothetical protein